MVHLKYELINRIRLPPNLTHDHRKCVHLVTVSYFWSCKIDGGHAVRSTIGEYPMLHAHLTVVCVIGDGKFNVHRSGYTHASVV